MSEEECEENTSAGECDGGFITDRIVGSVLGRIKDDCGMEDPVTFPLCLVWVERLT